MNPLRPFAHAWSAVPLSATILGISLGFSLACGETVPFKALPPVDQVGEPAADATADVTKTFSSGKTIPVDLTIDSGFENITQGFSLEQNPRQQEQYNQIERTLYNDSFSQGHKGISALQSFAVSEAGIFDLLLVIDNSSSMGPYQNRLSKTLPDILRYVQNTNWRIAVVTTSSPCLRKTIAGQPFITRQDFDRSALQADIDFQNLIKVGETGNPVERGIFMATQAMQETGCDAGNVAWLRPDSQRAVLLLTDENNCGSAPNEGCAGLPYEKAEYFFDRVGKSVVFNAMVLTQEPPNASSDPSDPNHDCENSGGYGEAPDPGEYLRIVAETGGRYADLCRSNYSTVLNQISEDVGKKINAQFELQYPAEISSLELKIDGRAVSKYNVNGRILTILEPVTERSGTLEVKYKHDPVAMVKNFTPSHGIDAKTLEVFVNETALGAKDYSYNESTGKVELRDLPAELAAIKLRYRSNAELPKTFAYVSDYYLETMEVSVAGQKTKDFTVDRTNRKVTLNTAPRDGQRVIFTYELPGDRRTDYPVLGVLIDEIEAFQIVDAASGEVLPAVLDGGQIKIDPLFVAGGRKVLAKYNIAHDYLNKQFVLETPNLPFPDSLKIEAEGDASVCTKDILVRAGKLSFSCTDEDFGAIRVSYAYAEDYRNTFDVSINFSGPKSYRVFINGVETTAYQLIDEQVVILKKDLPPDSEVKVIVHPDVI